MHPTADTLPVMYFQRLGAAGDARVMRLPLAVETSYYPYMKVKEVIKALEEDGWYLARTKGSHRQFKHPTKAGAVTVSGKPSVDVPPGTLNSILKQAGLK
jgi:predicted RNA binding protein YcfA (HicA-like mRNA interferase family)